MDPERKPNYDQIIAPHVLAEHGRTETPRGVPLTAWHDQDHETNQAALTHEHRRNPDYDRLKSEHDPADNHGDHRRTG